MKLIGDLSVFQLFVSVVALVTGAYTAYKSFLEVARVSIFPGEQVTLCSPGRGQEAPLKVWLGGVAVNAATKLGVLTHLRLKLIDPMGQTVVGRITRFIHSTAELLEFSAVNPIAVPARGSAPLYVEVEISYPEGLPNTWVEGRYAATLSGDVVGARTCRAAIATEFSFVVPDLLDMILSENTGRCVVAVD